VFYQLPGFFVIVTFRLCNKFFLGIETVRVRGPQELRQISGYPSFFWFFTRFSWCFTRFFVTFRLCYKFFLGIETVRGPQKIILFLLGFGFLPFGLLSVQSQKPRNPHPCLSPCSCVPPCLCMLVSSPILSHCSFMCFLCPLPWSSVLSSLSLSLVLSLIVFTV
jgi:hypothetical protein